MNLRSVSSSRMNAVGWENNTMYIKFKDGSVYAYMNVSESQYIDFINSPSLGSALARFDKVHPYHRV
ncbi:MULTISPECIES: KTSC domain-containing protein [unclassified Clostridium]|uniref:KTSC domain-containing protein n=1 Tax=unclassified Clostridium TaxID=2614128 RepID=UPI000297CF7D|nr:MULTISPECIES: KTSC domain-containing protein [unclassified Clostridium]EKQ56333.1 MAG: hypothetical protein A370_02089 [Clostridium sp. Maddingley MBC34-26]